MARSSAATVEEYLAELPAERREVVAAVRDVIRRNLPAGYDEQIRSGLISYEIPLSRHPKTYNGQPLMYAALAAQKNYYAVYLMSVYATTAEPAWFATEYAKTGKKLDMGKSCVRFKTLDDLPLELIGRVIAATPPEKFIALVETSRSGRR